MKQANKNNSGFMLLEVILSVLIVTIGIVFVVNSFLVSLKSSKVSKSYFNAMCLLENKIWEYEEKDEIEEGKDSGTFEDFKNAEWLIDAQELEDLPLLETELEVIINEKSGLRSFKVVTYFKGE